MLFLGRRSQHCQFDVLSDILYTGNKNFLTKEKRPWEFMQAKCNTKRYHQAHLNLRSKTVKDILPETDVDDLSESEHSQNIQ